MAREPRKLRGRPRRRAVATAAVLALSAAGCGAGSADEPGTGDDDGLFVAYVDGFCGNSWRTTVRAELEDEVAKHSEISDFQYRCAQGDLNKAVSDVRSLTAQGVDIILTYPDFGDAFAPALKAAREEGVTVVPWVVDVGDPDAYDAQLLDDNAAVGVLMADYFIEKLGGQGNVVAVGGTPGNSYDLAVIAAMEERLEAESEIAFLEFAPADWDPAKAGPVMATLLAKYDEVNAVFASEATMIPPILDQFKAAGRDYPQTTSFDVNGVWGTMLELMPDNPTLGYGYISARTWAIRDALNLALEIRDGKVLEDKTVYIDNELSDCSVTCADVHDPEMPDIWIGTGRVPADVMAGLLG